MDNAPSGADYVAHEAYEARDAGARNASELRRMQVQVDTLSKQIAELVKMYGKMYIFITTGEIK